MRGLRSSASSRARPSDISGRAEAAITEARSCSQACARASVACGSICEAWPRHREQRPQNRRSAGGEVDLRHESEQRGRERRGGGDQQLQVAVEAERARMAVGAAAEERAAEAEAAHENRQHRGGGEGRGAEDQPELPQPRRLVDERTKPRPEEERGDSGGGAQSGRENSRRVLQIVEFCAEYPHGCMRFLTHRDHPPTLALDLHEWPPYASSIVPAAHSSPHQKPVKEHMDGYRTH